MNTDKLKAIIKQYAEFNNKRCWFEITSTFLAIFASYAGFYFCKSFSLPLAAVFTCITALLYVRVFILQHDASHGSLFKNDKYNSMLGVFCSLFTLYPYYLWRREHIIHHREAQDLSKRPWIGGIEMYTVGEYKNLSRWEKLKYILYRNIFIFIILGGVYQLLRMRFRADIHKKTDKFKKHEILAIYYTNLAIFVIYGTLAYFFGLGFVVFGFFLPLILGNMVGVMLFFVQHNFEDLYVKEEKTNPYEVALSGSSYFKLPNILRWFTGNIGVHHIHHLSSRIPFFNLYKCFKENDIMQNVFTVTIKDIWKMYSYKLYDEIKGKMVTFKEYKASLAAAT